MKLKIHKIAPCRRKIEVEVQGGRIKALFEEVYKEIRRYAKLPGYRQGKVPMDMLERNYLKDAEEEVKKRVFNEVYRHILKSSGLVPVASPLRLSGVENISEHRRAESGIVNIIIELDVEPEFKLKSYKGIVVKSPRFEVTEEMVESSLKKYQEMLGEFVPVEGRVLQMDDYALCEIKCTVEDKVIHSAESEFICLVKENSNPLHSAIVETLLGVGKGESKVLDTRLPDDFPQKQNAGKEAHFDITVKEIKKKELKPVDDEFAKILGVESLEVLKDDIRKRLKMDTDKRAKEFIEQQMIKNLIEKNDSFSLPESLLALHCKDIFDRSKKDLKRELTKDEEKELEQYSKETAEKRLKFFFILNKIADAENIEVAKEDIEEDIRMMAQAHKKSFEEMTKEVEKHNMRDGIYEELRRRKTAKFLTDNAEIKVA